MSNWQWNSGKPMTESHSSTDHELNEAIAQYEQLCEGGRYDCLAETQLRFPACADELARYDRERCELMGCTRRFARHSAEGLHHAHRHGILHRDIKPANLLIDEEHRCLKVADFGLAKFDLYVAKGDEDASRPTIVGTLPYMSPEQCRDSDEVTVASDIYGLAQRSTKHSPAARRRPPILLGQRAIGLLSLHPGS